MPSIYRKGTKLPVLEYNFLLHQGGVGDLIAQLPAVKYCLDTQINIFVYLYVHDYGVPLCKKVFEKYDNIKIYGMSEAKLYYNDELPCRSPYIHKVSNLSSHLVDHAFYTIAHTSVENKHKNYIQLDPIDVTQFNLPEKYVVITSGYTSLTRRWPHDSINEVAQHCAKIGFTLVFLGRSHTPANETESIRGTFEGDYSLGINLIDKTDILEAHAIMSNAELVLGLDNGLCHLAAMSNVKIVYGFTSVLPEHRLPYRENKIGHRCYVVTPTAQELACIGCQSKQNFVSKDRDFKFCMYDDYECTEMMTSDRWIKQIEEALNETK